MNTHNTIKMINMLRCNLHVLIYACLAWNIYMAKKPLQYIKNFCFWNKINVNLKLKTLKLYSNIPLQAVKPNRHM